MPAHPDPNHRILAHCQSGRPGPTLVAFAGIHGNEPAGIEACRLIADALDSGQIPFRGQFIAIAGNLQAIDQNIRFIQRDLNRSWDDGDIDGLRAQDPSRDVAEDIEQRALLDVLDPLNAQADAPIVYIDLHSTSGHGAPFCAMADTLRNRKIAFALPIPVILGLEECIETVLLGWLSDLGHIGLVIEGGQHNDPNTVDFLASALWLTLVAGELVLAENAPDLDGAYAKLETAARGLPQVVEILHREAIVPEQIFRMKPGYDNFQIVAHQEHLAEDREGDILAPMDGRILMPLYQNVGEDGFFITRDVDRRWLTASAWLRRLRLCRTLTWLPGVHRHPRFPDRWVVDPNVARWHTRNVFHLFGYRRRHQEGELEIYSRRRPDHHPIHRR